MNNLRIGSVVYDFGSSSGRPAHACNCIGCCENCGQCLTAPWHAETCDKIAALNAERARVIAEATR